MALLPACQFHYSSSGGMKEIAPLKHCHDLSNDTPNPLSVRASISKVYIEISLAHEQF